MGSLDPANHNVQHPGDCKREFSGGYHRSGNWEKITELANQLKVQCLSEIAMVPWRSTPESTSYDIITVGSCMIPTKGKGVVQIGFVDSQLKIY